MQVKLSFRKAGSVGSFDSKLSRVQLPEFTRPKRSYPHGESIQESQDVHLMSVRGPIKVKKASWTLQPQISPLMIAKREMTRNCYSCASFTRKNVREKRVVSVSRERTQAKSVSSEANQRTTKASSLLLSRVFVFAY